MKTAKKSIRKAYLYSIAAFFIPCWIGSALLDSSAGDKGLDGSVIAAICFFACSSFAPSIGHYYFDRKKYAAISGLGRIALMAIFIGIDAYTNYNSSEPMHPYLSFIGIALAFFWGMADFGMINDAGKKYLSKREL